MRLFRRQFLSSLPIGVSFVRSKIVNAAALGAVGDGRTDGTQALNDAARAVPSGGLLELPQGRYRLTAPVLIRSGTTVRGQGVTIFGDVNEWRASPSVREEAKFSFLVNENFSADRFLDRDMAIKGLSFEYVGKQRGDAHAVAFRKARKVVIENCAFAGGGDGVSCLACEDTAVLHCISNGTLNCAYDFWEGPVGASVFDSIAVCAGGYGICFNSIGTKREDFRAVGCDLMRNRIEKSVAAGIWVSPLSGTSSIEDVWIIENTVIPASGSGIGVTGLVRNTVIQDNTVERTRGGNAIFARPDRWNRPSKTRIVGNRLIDCETSPNGMAAIQALGEGAVVEGNRATGGRYPALVWVDGPDHVARDNEGSFEAPRVKVTRPGLAAQ